MTARKTPAKAAKKAPAPARKPAKKAPTKRAPAKKRPTPAETPPPAPEIPPIDVEQELRDLRSALRARLTDPDTPGSAVAAISRELRAVNAELAALAPQEVSRVDDLAARRDARRAGAADSPPPARRSQPRRRGRGDRPS